MKTPGLVTTLYATALLAFVAPTLVSAQTGTIEGTVTHGGTGAPLSSIQIALEGTDRGVLSGDDGGFVLTDVPAGPYTVVATAMGYRTERRQIRVGVGQTVELEVEVAEQPVELSGITVVARRGGLVNTTATTVGKIDVPPAELPQSLSVITRAQLHVQNVISLSEAARYTPGVQTEPFGQEPRLTFIRIRGFDATTTGLYQDGLQLRNPGFAVGYNLEPYGAERIEVLRGPSSVLYGAGSPGGMVNYVSKRPTSVPLREVELEVASHERVQGKIDLSGPIDDEGTFAYRLTGVVRDGDTQVDFVENDRLFAAPSLTWSPGEHTRVTVMGHFKEDDTRASQALPAEGLLFDNPAGTVPVERFTGEPDVDRYDRTHLSAGYEAEHGGEWWTLRQRFRWYDVDLDDVTVFTMGLQDDGRTLNRAIFESFGEMDGLSLDNQALAEVHTGPLLHNLLAGVDFQSVDATSRQTFGGAPPLDVFDPQYGQPVPEAPVFANNETDQRQVGVYLEDRMELLDRWVLTLSGRYDWASTEIVSKIADSETDQDDSEFSGRAALAYTSGIGLMPYVSYSESFLPLIGTHPESGDQFEPETGRQWEGGLKWAPSDLNASVTLSLFDLTRDGFVQFDPETFLPAQTGEVTSTGLELEAVAGFREGFDVVGSLTAMDVEVTESTNPMELGKRPTQTPEFTASIWTDYTVQAGELEGLGLGLGVRHVGSTYGDAANTLEVPSFTLVDGALYYDWRGFRLALNAQNLFDDEYVASAFVRSSQLATFGPTRRITGSLRYRW